MSVTFTPTLNKIEAKKHYIITGGDVSFTLNFLNTWHADSWSWTYSDSNVVKVSDRMAYPTLTGSFDFTRVTTSLNSSPVRAYFKDANTADKATGTLTFTYGSKAPFLPAITSSGFVNPTQKTQMSFSVTTQKTTSQYTVASAVMYYKETGASSYSNVTLVDLSIPAGTFAWGKSYEAYFRCTADDGTVANTASTTFVTTDVVGTVRAISPSGTIENAVVEFTWDYSNNLGAPQYAYDLDYSLNNTSWNSLANHVISSATSATYTINTSGHIYWRVRAYNQNNVASGYATADFINNVPPQKPVITGITSESAPVITWSSNEQIAFEIEIDGVVKETIYTGGKEFKAPVYLLGDNYTAKLRTVNSLGTYSEPTIFSIQPAHYETAPEVTAEQVTNGIQITVSNQFDKYYLLRDGEIIAVFNGEYLDTKANSGNNTYTIVGVVGKLASSATIEVYYNCAVSTLISRDNVIIRINERLDNRPDVQYKKLQNGKLVQYLGREKPVWIDNGNYSRSWTVVCNNKDIFNHVGKIMKYRSSFGDNAYVVVRSANAAHRYYGSDINIVLDEVEYSEDIKYDL